MSKEFEMKLVGIKELQAGIRKLKNQVRDNRVLWRRVAPFLIFGLRVNLDTRGRALTTAKKNPTWVPYHKKYAAWKMKHGGGQMLVLTGALKGSFRINKVTQKQLRVGTKGLKYAGAVVWGGTIQQKARTLKMPRRRMMGFSPEMELWVYDQANKFYAAKLRQFFPRK